jgi:hypothetical protein
MKSISGKAHDVWKCTNGWFQADFIFHRYLSAATVHDLTRNEQLNL